MSRRSIRRASVAAVAAAIVGLVLTPFMATVFVVKPGVEWSDFTLVERIFGPTLESWGAITFGAGDAPYRVYGKAFFVVYLLMIPIVRLVHGAYRSAGGTSRLELWSWRVAFAALITATVGDVIAYWALSIPGSVGESIASAGFVIELAGMLVLVLLPGTAIYAVAAMRFGVVPRWAGWALILTLPLAWFTGTQVVGYIPNAAIVPLSIGWAAVGAWLLLATSDESRETWPTTIDTRSGSTLTPREMIRQYWATGLSGTLGVFMVLVGLLFVGDPNDGFTIFYGVVAILLGLAIFSGLYLSATARMTPSRLRLLMRVAIGVSAVGYFWLVLPLALGALVAWFGIHKDRILHELTPEPVRKGAVL